MMMAMTSSSHMMVPRLKKTNPRSHSTISITATTKSKSSNPISKASLAFKLKASILRCVTGNKHLQLRRPFLFQLLEAFMCVLDYF